MVPFLPAAFDAAAHREAGVYIRGAGGKHTHRLINVIRVRSMSSSHHSNTRNSELRRSPRIGTRVFGGGKAVHILEFWARGDF